MPRRKVLLADSSSLIALDRTGRLSVLREFVTFVPPAVKKEIVDKALAVRPDSPFYPDALASANRFRYFIERGDIQVLTIDYASHGGVLDRVRRRLARLDDSREDRVPKADTEMAAGMAQLVEDGQDFDVLCEDRALVKVLKQIFPQVSYRTSEDLVD